MTAAFDRLAKSLLNHLGQEALLLRGTTTTPCRVNIEHGVQMAGMYDDAVFTRDVATFEAAVDAAVGDVLQHPTKGEYTLDGLMADNGHTRRFTLQPKV